MPDEIIKDNQPSPPEQKNPSLNWAKIGIFFSTLAIMIFIFGFGYGYFALSKVNIMLAQMITDTETKTAEIGQKVKQLETSVNHLEEAAQKNQELSSQQEKLIYEWQAAKQSHLNKGYVTGAFYLVSLANDQIQFTNNISLARQLLQQAIEALKNVQDTKLSEINSSLAADRANLNSVPDVDINVLYLRVNDLDQQIDQLPLPITSLQKENKNAAQTNTSPELSWWKAGLQQTKQALAKIVLVRYHGADSLPLILPDEKIFLYQNLHAQIGRILWSLQERNQKLYELSIEQTVNWIKKYFVPNASETKVILSQLEDLKKINIHPEVKPLTKTLQLFNDYFAAKEMDEMKGTAQVMGST